MKTIILATVIKLLMPLFIIFSLYLLFRGHNDPGGGFIGGLIGSIGFVFYTMTYGPEETRRKYKINAMVIIASGLLIAGLSGVISMFFGDPFLTARWEDYYLPFIGRPGTPLMFDVGVYILVMGIVLKITLAMSET
ncbi:MAG: Na+/H+ antiporter subunit B [Bacteroidota bacterium]|nr:Na+/H+ antiporter subunit B [Bacteroidota bacterium]